MNNMYITIENLDAFGYEGKCSRFDMTYIVHLDKKEIIIWSDQGDVLYRSTGNFKDLGESMVIVWGELEYLTWKKDGYDG